MNQVRNNTVKQRFELEVDGLVAFADYREQPPGTLILPHTEVPPALGGRGVGSALVAGALAQIRDAGQHVVPSCSFVAAYIKRHPEFQPLLAERADGASPGDGSLTD
jgi:predicted GNAT family acetyltransferase